jgi:hypothetical protein
MDRGTRRNPNQDRAECHRRAHQEPDEYAVVGHYRGNLLLSSFVPGKLGSRPGSPILIRQAKDAFLPA